MTSSILFQRSPDDRFLIEALPDGSIAIFDSRTEAVHSLNPAAALVLEACAEPVTLSDVTTVLWRTTEGGVPAESALEVLKRLEAAELIVRIDAEAPLAPSGTSRRDLLKKVAFGSAAALALPAILTLTGAEQRLYAQEAGSGFAATTREPGTTTPIPE